VCIVAVAAPSVKRAGGKVDPPPPKSATAAQSSVFVFKAAPAANSQTTSARPAGMLVVDI